LVVHGEFSHPVSSTLLTLAAFCIASPAPGGLVHRAGSDSLARLYESGRTWRDFFEAVRARRSLWVENYREGSPAVELVARARAVGGSWRLLVVAVDSCSDSANTIPYLVRLVEQVPGLELRIVSSAAGRRVMEQHRTPDGRAATPTVLLLDPGYAERGCFVERPRALRRWLADRAGASEDQRFEAKMDWYRRDRGAETVKELVELLEAAAAGAPICERGAAP
jgi:hypothetical protein